MLKWLGKMIGQPSTPAPPGVPAPWLFRLENLLALVDGCPDKLRDGLTRDMVQYVLHGTPEAMLHEVGQLGPVVRQLRLLRAFAHGQKIEHDIYEHFEDLPIDVALRYARLLDAFGPPHALLCLQLPPGLRWLEVLMVHAAQCPIDGYSSHQPKPASLSAARLEAMLVAAGAQAGALLVSAFSTPIPTGNAARTQLWEQRLAMASELTGYPDALDRHIEQLRPLLLPKGAVQRRHIVNMLHKAAPATLARLPPELRKLFMTGSQPVAHRVHEVPVIDWSAAGNAVAPGFLQTFWQKVNDGIAVHNQTLREQHPELLTKPSRHPLLQQAAPYDEVDAWALAAYLASDERCRPLQPRDGSTAWVHVAPVLEAMAGDGLTPVALFRTLQFFDLAGDDEGKLQYPAVRAFNALHRHSGRPTLLELARLMDDAGLSGSALRRNYCNTWADAIGEGWAPEAVWPYFMHHAESVAHALVDTRNNEPAFRPALLTALRLLPTLPDAVVVALFQLALGSAKTDRLAAQDTLNAYPGKEGRILGALGDGKAATRAVAAEWLGRLRHRPAVGALRQALAKEKQEAARRAMQEALQALNEPTD